MNNETTMLFLLAAIVYLAPDTVPERRRHYGWIFLIMAAISLIARAIEQALQ